MGTLRSVTAFVVAAAVLVTAMVVRAPTPAWAGGSWLYPVQERYEPGDAVTLVGYVVGDGSLGSADDGPFFAYLRPTPTVSDGSDGLPELAPFTPRATDIALGEIDLAATGKGGYLEYRAAIGFTLPRDLT